MLADGSLERTATQLPPEERYCTCCHKALKGSLTWLEFDRRIDGYHDFGGVPVEESQGLFVFGKTCAKKQEDEARRKLNEWRFS